MIHTFVKSFEVSTHSRLKAAGVHIHYCYQIYMRVSTHSRLKAAGADMVGRVMKMRWFQHTAA